VNNEVKNVNDINQLHILIHCPSFLPSFRIEENEEICGSRKMRKSHSSSTVISRKEEICGRNEEGRKVALFPRRLP